MSPAATALDVVSCATTISTDEAIVSLKSSNAHAIMDN
jgi:hypothetical protein